jgi:hypothetical protein
VPWPARPCRAANDYDGDDHDSLNKGINMRTFLIGTILGCLIASALQATPQASLSRTTLNIGADLTLGMTEEVAVKRLTEYGYSLKKIEPSKVFLDVGITSIWIINEKDGTNVGTMSFASGKLNEAGKSLFPDEGDAVEFGRRLYRRPASLRGDRITHHGRW